MSRSHPNAPTTTIVWKSFPGLLMRKPSGIDGKRTTVGDETLAVTGDLDTVPARPARVAIRAPVDTPHRVVHIVAIRGLDERRLLDSKPAALDSRRGPRACGCRARRRCSRRAQPLRRSNVRPTRYQMRDRESAPVRIDEIGNRLSRKVAVVRETPRIQHSCRRSRFLERAARNWSESCETSGQAAHLRPASGDLNRIGKGYRGEEEGHKHQLPGAYARIKARE